MIIEYEVRTMIISLASTISSATYDEFDYLSCLLWNWKGNTIQPDMTYMVYSPNFLYMLFFQ